MDVIVCHRCNERKPQQETILLPFGRGNGQKLVWKPLCGSCYDRFREFINGGIEILRDQEDDDERYSYA